MKELRHNIISTLYSLKGLIDLHRLCVKEGKFSGSEEALKHAEEVLGKAYLQADRALQITRRLRVLYDQDGDTGSGGEGASLRKVWEEVGLLIQKKFRYGRLEMIERIPEEFPEIQCAPGNLKEILYQLSCNAIQAMKEEGKLVIRAQIAFSAQEQPYALLTLSDTGPGIGEGQIPQLFLPFYTTKKEEEGNGLGLCLVRALVLKNHGRITVSSFRGEGTTFTLEFPVLRLSSASPAVIS